MVNTFSENVCMNYSFIFSSPALALDSSWITDEELASDEARDTRPGTSVVDDELGVSL